MEILFLLEALALASLLFVHTEPASAADASIEVDAILGAGRSLLVIDVVHGDAATTNHTPTIDGGSYTPVVN